MPQLQEGQVAPDFTLLNAEGKEISLSDYSGQGVIVYFYPRAMTPGCTTEACDFRDNLDLLAHHGYAVIGVSPDQPEALAQFARKEDLNFTLLSDPSKDMMNRWGAFGEKKNYGKVIQGVIRSTVVLNKDHKVIFAKYNVKATGHVARIIKELDIAS